MLNILITTLIRYDHDQNYNTLFSLESLNQSWESLATVVTINLAMY